MKGENARPRFSARRSSTLHLPTKDGLFASPDQPCDRTDGAGEGGDKTRSPARAPTKCTTGLPQRRCRLRGRDRSGDRKAERVPLRDRRRRRALHQSHDRARPDPWRHRAGRGPGDVANSCIVEPESGQVLSGSFLGLLHPALRHAAELRHRDRRGAVADQSAGHQGRRRRRHDACARAVINAAWMR